MGNYRFRLSDMIPNAWFNKLKDTSKSRNKQNITRPTNKKHKHKSSSSSSSIAAPALSSKTTQPHLSVLSHQRKSYYFTRDLTPAPSLANDDHISDDGTANARSSNASYSEPATKSSKKKGFTRRKRPSIANRPTPRQVSSSVYAGCSCRATIESVWTKPDSTPEEYPNSPIESSSENEPLIIPEFCSSCGITPETFDRMLSCSASCGCRVKNDIIIDVENKALNSKFNGEPPELDGFDTVSELNLPPIIIKANKFCGAQAKDLMKEIEINEPSRLRRRSSANYEFKERNAYGSLSVKVMKENILGTSNSSSKEKTSSPARRFSTSSPGLKLRTNSPRIANKRIQAEKSRRSVSESFAVVKSSKDPQRDFKESMVEMIVENNICASKDLEDLLACYLSLNAVEYHELIIKVFKQIWFDIVDIHPK